MEIFLCNSFLCNNTVDVQQIRCYEEAKEEIVNYASKNCIVLDSLFQRELGLPDTSKPIELLSLPKATVVTLRKNLPESDVEEHMLIDSLAVGMLEYYKMNTQYTMTQNKTTFSIYEFYMNLKELGDVQLALTTIANVAEMVLPSIKVSPKLTHIVITNNTIYIPSSITFIKEYKLMSAVLKLVFEVLLDDSSLASTLEYVTELLDCGGVYEVFVPSGELAKQLNNYHLLELNGKMPSLSSQFNKIGYTLPNLLDTYNSETQQSMYMSKDNTNVIIVQWLNFELVGTVVLTISDAQKIYRNKSPLQFMTGFKLLLSNPNLVDQSIATLNGVPLYEILNVKLEDVLSPNILV